MARLMGVSELRASAAASGAFRPGERRLAVPGPLHSLLPEGVERGSTVVVGGSTTLALALIAALGRDGGWVAGVGWESVGLMAAHEAGVGWDRVVAVGVEDRQKWPVVLATVVEAFDVVLVGSGWRVGAGDARRVAARSRERGTVLVVAEARAGVSVGEIWPLPPEVRLRVVDDRWQGLGDGHGYLRSRRVTVEAGGRGRLSRPRRQELRFPGGETDGLHLLGADLEQAEPLEQAELLEQAVS